MQNRSPSAGGELAEEGAAPDLPTVDRDDETRARRPDIVREPVEGGVEGSLIDRP